MHSKGDHKQNDSPPDWQEIFVNHLTDKGLISKIHKQLFKLNIKNSKQPNQKIGTRSKYTFLQRRHTDGKKKKQTHTQKDDSTLLIIREIKIKTAVRYHIGIHIGQNGHHQDNTRWREHGIKETLLHCWWGCKLVQSMWRTVWRFLKKTLKRVAV